MEIKTSCYRETHRVLFTGTALLILASLMACVRAPPPSVDERIDVERADRLFAARDYAAAAALYEQALAENPRRQESRLRFRLAMIHALRDSPLHDRESARELLKKLADDEPPRAWRDMARLYLELKNELAATRTALEAERSTAARLEELLADNATDAASLHRCLGNLRQEVDEQVGMTDEIERLARELERCREQVEKLKAIDLEPPP